MAPRKATPPTPRRWRGRLWRWASTAHLWVGVIVGLQAVAWLLSGLVMSWLDLDIVHGDHLVARQAAVPLAGIERLLPPAELAARHRLAPHSLTLTSLDGRPVWQATGADGPALFDAASGARLDPLTPALVRAIASRAYRGDGAVAGVRLLTREPGDWRRPLPVWQVRFADADHTRLYIAPATGRIEAVRTDTWRLFDWFWMLHIMDYDAREDINGLLLRGAAGLGLLLGLSGLVLLGLRLTRR